MKSVTVTVEAPGLIMKGTDKYINKILERISHNKTKENYILPNCSYP